MSWSGSMGGYGASPYPHPRAQPLDDGSDALSEVDALPPILGAGALAFVGRSRELEALGRARASAVGGNGRLVLLSGEAGIGKTRTAQEFASTVAAGEDRFGAPSADRTGGAASGDGLIVLWGRCFEGEWSPPYGPWAGALGDLARTADPEWLRRMVGLGAPPLAQLVPAIRAALPDAPPPASLPPEEERFRLYDAVVGFLVNAARTQPILLVLDDLHWADRASLGLLRHLARFVERSRLLVVGLYRDGDLGRDHPLPAVLAELRREPGTQALRLRGLSPGEVADLLHQAARRSIAPELAEAISRETDGNPFFAGELLRHLLEEGRLVERDGRWAAEGSLDELGIPEGVRHVVLRRLSNLSPETNQLLGYAAVFTGGFDFRVLQALTELPEETLLDGLDEVLAAGLIRPIDGKSETYDFVHAIVRHAISDGWGPSRRVRLHRRLAEALERVHAGRELDVAAELAFQYHESATLPGAAKGILYALAAADRAKASSAREQAVTFLRMARDLAEDVDYGSRGSILAKLAIAEAEALLHEEAQRTVEQALAALEEGEAAPESIASFLATAAAALKDNGADATVWRPLVDRGLRVLGDRRDLTWARLTVLIERFAPISSGAIFAARWLGVDPEAVAIARASGEEDDYARTLQPFEGRGRAETEALLYRVRTWQRPAAIIRALIVLGAEWVYTLGAFREAVGHFQDLLTIAERNGSLIGRAEALVRLTLVQIALGEREAARKTAEAAREAVSRLSPNHRLQASLSWIDAFRTEYWGGAEDWPLLARFWTRYVGDPAKAESAIVLDDAALAAFAHVRAGTTAEARRLLAALTAGLAPLDAGVWLLNGAVGVGAGAVWELETAEQAPVYLDLARELIAAGVGDYLCCSNELTVARMLALLGRQAEAGAAFARARTQLDASGQRPLRAIVDHDEALMLLRAAKGQPDTATRERVARLLEAAIGGFEALAMADWAERARALLPEPVAAPTGRRRGGLPAGLTTREVDILQLVARGHSDRQISEQLYLSPRTVNAHIRHMLAKTTLANRTELSVWAVEQGLVER
jgi:DNA-binding NarL/FixJ family response regulator